MAELVEDGCSIEKGAIIALVPDLFFSVTIRNTIRRLGFDPHIVKTADDLEDVIPTADPVLAVVDVSAVRQESDWQTIADVERDGLPVLVFGAHKDVDGLRAAKAAGVTRVVSNGQFHREMGDLIARYARAPHVHPTEVDDELDEPMTQGSLPPGMHDHVHLAEGAASGDK